MKKLLLIISMCFMLVGCQKPLGNINQINMNEVLQKMENKETFMFMLGFDFCSTCQWFKEEVLPGYLKDHELEFNLVELSYEMSDEELNPVFQFILDHPNPPEYLLEGQTETEPLAPSFYFIVDGEVEEIFIGPEMDESKLDQFVQKYQLIQ